MARKVTARKEHEEHPIDLEEAIANEVNAGVVPLHASEPVKTKRVRTSLATGLIAIDPPGTCAPPPAGNPNKRERYPFTLLTEIGASFHIPATEETPEPWTKLNASLISANKRLSPRHFIVFEAPETHPKGPGAVVMYDKDLPLLVVHVPTYKFNVTCDFNENDDVVEIAEPSSEDVAETAEPDSDDVVEENFADE